MSSQGDDLQKCWADDERMNVFFSPFRERSANPQSWDSKMNFWMSYIYNFCKTKNVLFFNLSVLQDRFKRNGKSPLCLATVLDEMKKCRKAVPLEKFMASADDTWLAWSVSTFITKPMSWAWSKAIGSRREASDDGYIVHLDLVMKRADSLLARVHENASHPIDYIMKIADLKNMCSDLIGDSEENLRLLVKYLENKHVALLIKDHCDIVKFSSQSTLPVIGLNDVEKGILRLKEMESNLEKEIVEIAARMERLREEARLYLSTDARSSAKGCLKRKQVLQSTLDLREQNLDNLRHLLQKIYSAHTEAKIVEAYEFGVKALKGHSKEFNMSADRVGDTIDSVRETLDEQEDIATLLSAVGTESDVTSTDLEKELAAILDSDEALGSDQEEQLAATRMNYGLPKVPSHEPSIRSSTPPRKPASPKKVAVTAFY